MLWVLPSPETSVEICVTAAAPNVLSIHLAAASPISVRICSGRTAGMPNEAIWSERVAGSPVVVAAAGATVAVAPDSSRRLAGGGGPRQRRGGGKIGTAGPAQPVEQTGQRRRGHRTAGSGGGHHGHLGGGRSGNPRDPRDDGSGGRRKVFGHRNRGDDLGRRVADGGRGDGISRVGGRRRRAVVGEAASSPSGSDTAAGSAANRRNRPGEGTAGAVCAADRPCAAGGISVGLAGVAALGARREPDRLPLRVAEELSADVRVAPVSEEALLSAAASGSPAMTPPTPSATASAPTRPIWFVGRRLPKPSNVLTVDHLTAPNGSAPWRRQTDLSGISQVCGRRHYEGSRGLPNGP